MNKLKGYGQRNLGLINWVKSHEYIYNTTGNIQAKAM